MKRAVYLMGGVMGLLASVEGANAQNVLDLKGTWNPSQGAHIVDGPSRHHESGMSALPGQDNLKRHNSKFVFRIEGQDGRTFWGTLSSEKVSETLIGALSVDGKQFVMADKDGTFRGSVVDTNTLDYCYSHVTPADIAVACGLLVRER
ncbi:MAG: hypothetical protein KF735_25520 [Chelatococcus sp.]|uniref:hypothetical protein n=1 Tax=Chelatococcus sp. TaxID=1953771 RepID=UPI0025C662F7|nr:hypothetical protein [Chelatococcus sp.]MBX3541027.1 hypothetical protein [Chelatococcus sp.]